VLGVQPAARAVLLPRDGLLPLLLPHVLARAALAAHHDSPQAADAGQQDFVPVLGGSEAHVDPSLPSFTLGWTSDKLGPPSITPASKSQLYENAAGT
jgi:hypothetical protein